MTCPRALRQIIVLATVVASMAIFTSSASAFVAFDAGNHPAAGGTYPYRTSCWTQSYNQQYNGSNAWMYTAWAGLGLYCNATQFRSRVGACQDSRAGIYSATTGYFYPQYNSQVYPASGSWIRQCY